MSNICAITSTTNLSRQHDEILDSKEENRFFGQLSFSNYTLLTSQSYYLFTSGDFSVVRLFVTVSCRDVSLQLYGFQAFLYRFFPLEFSKKNENEDRELCLESKKLTLTFGEFEHTQLMYG